MYAVLGLKAAAQRGLPLVNVAQHHFASYLAGAYLGSDIQTMPEAVCVDTGRECGYGTVPVEKSPFTGGAVRPFTLGTPEGPLRPQRVFERFYGRAHLVFGWTLGDVALRVPWDHLADYGAAVCDDALALYPPGERRLAYALGWLVHVVSDSLIKGIQPGVELNLLDGRYTARNRPVQDLVTFHEIGIGDLALNWPALFNDLADTPVEPLQVHYMRCTEPRGKLGQMFAAGWRPQDEPTLHAVLVENRRWFRQHAADVLADMRLEHGECNAALRERTGLNYAEMREAAERAHFPHTLWKIAEEVASLFAAITQRSSALAALPPGKGPDWPALKRRWGVPD
jgi:hypothetical protein